MEAQWNIRQNALEAQDYVKDLLNWQQNIKKQVHNPSASAAETAALPAVRGRVAAPSQPPADHLTQPALGPARSSDSNKKNQSTAQHAAAHTYTQYKKWDSFDVDAALSEVEASNEKPQAPAIKKPQPTPSAAAASKPGQPGAGIRVLESRHTTAEGWKNLGNRQFQQGEYKQAIDSYTMSIGLEPTCLAYANRAMALLKQGKHSDAEQDCSTAIRIDPTYIKAYQRRATARTALGRQLDAAADYDEALRLQPDSKAIMADRDKALAAHLAAAKLQMQMPSTRLAVKREGAAAQAVGPKAPAEQAAPASAPAPAAAVPAAGAAAAGPARGAPTAEPAGAAAPSLTAAAEPAEPAEAAATSQHIVPEQAASASTAAVVMPSTGAGPSQAAGAAGAGAPALARPQQQAAAKGPAAAASAAPQQQQAQPQPASPSPPPSTTTPAGSPPPAAKPRAASPAAQAARATTAAAAITSSSRTHPHLKPPRTGVEFESTWRSLKGDQAAQSAYLLLLPPASLPSIFKTSLTAQVLVAMLHAALAGLAGPAADADVQQYLAMLAGLPAVPRFDMAAMSVGSKDKAALRQAWEGAAAALAAAHAQELQQLRSKFRL